ncbi:MAG: hypothetical protein PWQ67_964 [Clostridia bacterium]|jgi:hypothetical protein|nr:hypothetical protein [Clostridia bacterium]MDN5322510.1 hypothetical protein [Clostridia bacterium]
MNNGSAIIVEPLVLFHKILDKIVRGGLLVKNVNPAIPTRKRDRPTHIVLPKNRMRRPNKVKEIINKFKVNIPLTTKSSYESNVNFTLDKIEKLVSMVQTFKP